MTISLCTVETQYHSLAKYALEQTLKHIKVDEVIVFSNRNFFPESKHVQVEHFSRINDFNEFMIHGMVDHVNTDHILFVQWDAMAYNSSLWDNSFLEYDYIGAPWPWWPDKENVGNGGFSLRSKKLLRACQDPDFVLYNDSEDVAICRTNRPLLESRHNIQFAPKNVASRFSYELGTYTSTVGYHGPWNVVRLADEQTVEFYLDHMDYDSWNFVKWHHVMIEVVRRKRIDWFEKLLKIVQHSKPAWVNPLVAQVENFDYTKDLT